MENDFMPAKVGRKSRRLPVKGGAGILWRNFPRICGLWVGGCAAFQKCWLVIGPQKTYSPR